MKIFTCSVYIIYIQMYIYIYILPKKKKIIEFLKHSKNLKNNGEKLPGNSKLSFSVLIVLKLLQKGIKKKMES